MRPALGEQFQQAAQQAARCMSRGVRGVGGGGGEYFSQMPGWTVYIHVCSDTEQDGGGWDSGGEAPNQRAEIDYLNRPALRKTRRSRIAQHLLAYAELSPSQADKRDMRADVERGLQFLQSGAGSCSVSVLRRRVMGAWDGCVCRSSRPAFHHAVGLVVKYYGSELCRNKKRRYCVWTWQHSAIRYARCTEAPG